MNSWAYIIASAILFATTKLLCWFTCTDGFTVLIIPLSLFCLLTALYFSAFINSTFEKDNPRRKKAFLFLALYLIVACFLMWYPCHKYHEVVHFFFDTTTFETSSWERGMEDSMYEINYHWCFCQLYSGVLTAVFLPCIIKAFLCLVSEMKKRIEATNSQKEIKEQRCTFFLVYTPTLLLMLPFVIAVFSWPIILLQIVSMLWRKHKRLFWATQILCGLVLVGFLSWYYIKMPLLQ